MEEVVQQLDPAAFEKPAAKEPAHQGFCIFIFTSHIGRRAARGSDAINHHQKNGHNDKRQIGHHRAE